uniref:Integrase catalytic domain-containing protein n=1 Tax=Ananas comosus var. bracteatus TaxID=296719 RepID=A0A6V7QCJ6_ANACO|nr:unnamed protein product [Ananas comosus var. bracteatus]
MRNDHEAGGSSPVPWLKSKIERPVLAEPEEKMTRRELENKIASLETIIKRERWPPKEREVRMESDSSAETAKESEEKKQRIQEKSVDEGLTDVNMVYTLAQSFKAEYTEYEEMEEEVGLNVAQLELEDAKLADAVVFEKPSAIQTRFVRPLFIRALIEGRPVGRVMVDSGAMVNVMPILFFKKLGKDEDELKPTDTIMTDFTGSGQQWQPYWSPPRISRSPPSRTALRPTQAPGPNPSPPSPALPPPPRSPFFLFVFVGMVRSNFFVLSAFAAVVAVLPRERSRLPVRCGVPPLAFPSSSLRSRDAVRYGASLTSVARLPCPVRLFVQSGWWHCAVGGVGCVFSSAARVRPYSPAWLLPVVCGQQALISINARQLTTSYTPQQNGVAERKNRNLVEMAKSMLKAKNLSNNFWA